MSGGLGFPSLGMNLVSLFMEIVEDQGVALVTGGVGAVSLILSLSLIYMILVCYFMFGEGPAKYWEFGILGGTKTGMKM